MAEVVAAPQPVESMTDRQLARRRTRCSSAVMQLALERGIDKVQMKLVAEHSGVALGTTYRYFASKEHLLASALVDWHARLTDKDASPNQAAHFVGEVAGRPAWSNSCTAGCGASSATPVMRT